MFNAIKNNFRMLIIQLQVASPGESPLSLNEHLERFVTNSPAHLFLHLYTAWKYEQVLETDPRREKEAGDPYVEVERKWIYGRPLTISAIKTYRWLKTMGMNRRNLRLAVSCNYIQDDGRIHINWKKEHILRAISWAVVFISMALWLGITFILVIGPNNPLPATGISIISFIVIAAYAYTIAVLGIRPLLIARKIEMITKN